MSDRMDIQHHQDFTQTGASPEPDAPMFAPEPIYARQVGRKRRGAGRIAPAAPAVAAEPRSFADPAATAEPATNIATDTDLGMAGARRAPSATRKSSGLAPAAMAGGAVAVAALAGVVFFTANGDEAAVAQAPAAAPIAALPAPVPMETADLTSAPSVPAAPQAVNPAAAAAAPQASTRATRVARTPSPRPAATAASAAEVSADASASAALPDGPQPYTSLADSIPAQAGPPQDSSPAASVEAVAPEPAAPSVEPAAPDAGVIP